MRRKGTHETPMDRGFQGSVGMLHYRTRCNLGRPLRLRRRHRKADGGGGNFDEWLPILSPGCLVCLTEFFDEYERELVLRAVVPQPLRERLYPIHAYVR